MNRPIGWAVAAVVAAIGIVSGLTEVANGIRVPVTGMALGRSDQGIQLQGAYLIQYWWIFGGLLLVSLVLALLLVVYAAGVLLRSEQSIIGAGKAEYDRTADALRNVIFKLYNSAGLQKDPPPRITFTSIECTFEVSASGDTKVTQTYTVSAENEPAHFWTVRIAADEFAKPIRTLRDIEFYATSKNKGRELEFLPLGTAGLERQIAVFFLPEIAPRETRKFEVGYHWKGWFGELFGLPRRTTWHWSYRSARDDDHAKVKFVFRFSKNCGRIDCMMGHSPVDGDRLSQTASPAGDTIWTFSNANCPIGRMNWQLRFERS